MNFRNIFATCVALFALSAPVSALADDTCPAGTTGFINVETYEKICIPNQPPEQHVQTVQTTQSESEQNEQTVQTAQSEPEQNEQTAETAPVPAQAAENVTAQPVQTTQTLQNEPPSLTPENTQPVISIVYPTLPQSPDQIIHENAKIPGWSMLFGLGYALLANIQLHVMTGYSFGSNDSDAGFGLYFDADINPGAAPDFEMDLDIMPALHVYHSTFRFTLGMGIGLSVAYDHETLDYFYNVDYYEDEEGPRTLCTFELKPNISFDWFLTNNAMFGFGLGVPLLISTTFDNTVMPEFNFDLHIGYKF